MRDIIVYVSGKASTLDNICQHISDGKLNAKIRMVVSHNFKSIPIIEKHNLNFHKTDNPHDPNLFKNKCLQILAGWNKLVTIPEPAWGYPILNIHPSLLPKYGGKGYYGIKVHEAVLAAGEKESGCSVHWVDAEYDHGKVIAQKVVPVFDNDLPSTLQERVKSAERELCPKVIQNILEDLCA